MKSEIKYVILLKSGNTLCYVMSRNIRTISNEKYVNSSEVLYMAILFDTIEETNDFIMLSELYKKHEVLICTYECYYNNPRECLEILPFKSAIRKLKIDKIKSKKKSKRKWREMYSFFT